VGGVWRLGDEKALAKDSVGPDRPRKRFSVGTAPAFVGAARTIDKSREGLASSIIRILHDRPVTTPATGCRSPVIPPAPARMPQRRDAWNGHSPWDLNMGGGSHRRELGS